MGTRSNGDGTCPGQRIAAYGAVTRSHLAASSRGVTTPSHGGRVGALGQTTTITPHGRRGLSTKSPEARSVLTRHINGPTSSCLDVGRATIGRPETATHGEGVGVRSA